MEDTSSPWSVPVSHPKSISLSPFLIRTITDVTPQRLSQVQHYLEEQDLPVHDTPDDESDDAPRQSYNFAPGYYGAVYRADVPDRGAQTESLAPSHPEEAGEATTTEASEEAPTEAPTKEKSPRYKLQSMKWGLVPSWTKRSPNYASMLKTINCRSDSLSGTGGLWSSMKARKRCIVVADGFYEWLKVGPKERVPHYIKRKDGQPMLFAGLWDCVRFEGEFPSLPPITLEGWPYATGGEGAYVRVLTCG